MAWQCNTCELINNAQDLKCIACFTLNSRVCYECTKCGSLNSNRTKDCINCIIHNSSSKKNQSQLHFSTEIDSITKEVLIFGYTRLINSERSIVDINNMILKFYNEAVHWHIDCESLKGYGDGNTSTDRSEKLSKLYPGDFFTIQGIKMRWMLDPYQREYSSFMRQNKPVKLIGMTLHIPGIASGEIENIKLYISLCCPQNWAIFKRHTDIRWFQQNGLSDYFEMRLEYQKCKEFSIYHYIDLLSVEYKDGRKYNKDIKIKAKTELTWKIEGDLLQEMKDCFNLQMFHSKLFDSTNNNWCLRLFPKVKKGFVGDNYGSQLVVTWFRLPHKIMNFTVKVTVENNITSKAILKFLNFSNLAPWSELNDPIDIFQTTKLLHCQCLMITATVEIQQVNGDSDPNNWKKYGIDHI